MSATNLATFVASLGLSFQLLLLVMSVFFSFFYWHRVFMNDPPGMLQHLPLIRRAHQFSPLTKFGPIQSSLASSLARWSSSRLTSEFKSLFSVGGLIGCFNERRVQSIVEIWRRCLRIGANFK